MKELNHPGAARRAPVTSSSLKSKCPNLHLGDRRGILPLFIGQRNALMQTPLPHKRPRSARWRAMGRTNAGLADVNSQIGAGAFAVAVYQTVCPFSNPRH